MSDPLRDRRPVRELAKRRQVIEISIEIGDFERLSAVVGADLATLDPDILPRGWRKRPVAGRLAFGYDCAQVDVATVEGRVDATLFSVCQRCLEPFEWRLVTEVKFELIAAADMREGYEGHDGFELWELDGDDASPIEIVDEALVMAMPLAARHDDLTDCVDAAFAPEEDTSSEGDGKRMTTPFAALRAQMDAETKK